MATLERAKQQKETSYETISYNNGALTVANVKYVTHYSDNGIEEYKVIPGSVSLRLSAVTDYMQENEMEYFDFNDYDNYPEIEERINALRRQR